MIQEVGHTNNTVVLIFWYFQCLNLMYSELAWVLVSSGAQVELQIIFEPNYLPDYLSVSHEYEKIFNYDWCKPNESLIKRFQYSKVHTIFQESLRNSSRYLVVWNFLF